MVDIKCVWEEPAILGEGPLWVARENAVYWVDIVGKKIHRFGLADGARCTWTFEAQVTSLAARQQGGFVGTVRNGFAFIDLETGAVEPIAMPETDLPGNRFNDGKVDAKGCYWAGSMDDGEKLETGSLYRLDGDLSLNKIDDNYFITNGPAFSLDGKTLYHTDTAKRTIYAFDVSEDGAIANKRVFVKLEAEEEGNPDGMTVDSQNCIWLSHFAGSRITRYSPEGQVLQVIAMPVPNITSCTFAGTDLDTLYITTARHLLSEEEIHQYPLSGSLFACKPGVTGCPTPLFAG
ncbi:MAG: SMP-30/gluconolactonase/LRE family protein [Desulfobacterales bacterium]|jgi:sugar lactone lactonase YvrE